MARTAKKIAVKFLLGLFRVLMVGKRILVFLLSSLKEPFARIWTYALHPVATVFYQGYRTVKRAAFRVIEPMQDSATGFLTSKYAVHTIVILVSFFVTATNIAASGEVPAPIEGDPSKASIIGNMTRSEYDELVIEIADNVNFAQDVTYLGTYALTAAQFYATESSYLGADDGIYDDSSDGALVESHVDNAISAQPDAEAEASGTRTRTVQHTVQQGENIGAIARAYGLSTETVLQGNGLTARSIIRPGQVLDIPPIDGVTYTVRSGDTLNAIATKYDSTVQEIMEYNQLASATALRVGSDIILPGGKIPARPVSTPSPTRPSSSVASIFVPPAAEPDTTTKLLWPTAATIITQYYKYGHTGADIAGPMGTAIYAADDGVVTFSGWNSGGYGNMTIVDHGNGLYTRYAHASKNLFKKGDVVHRGEVIALMGSTGRSTGPHLHFEVMKGGIYNRVNPFDYIQ